MADQSSAWKVNIPGLYFVDDQCIACDACVTEAPNYFIIDEDEGHAFVKLQPTDEKGLIEAENALEACPVEAIGKRT
ncbi:MAG: ferredoxin [Halobacteriovoraceae bacterium]|jgi:ferredoxin|nr:ferredoxin [Halobacteriovoraceae bacterium]MBT5095311.1 ferredoxin [Halobacteriovoraceae bacterium]